MSEVDSLSKSGLHPLIPLGDRKQDPNDARGRPPPEQQGDSPGPGQSRPGPPRPPKSIIDEYA
jgi:hypothetical protein